VLVLLLLLGFGSVLVLLLLFGFGTCSVRGDREELCDGGACAVAVERKREDLVPV
jgi:hypothetical protein